MAVAAFVVVDLAGFVGSKIVELDVIADFAAKFLADDFVAVVEKIACLSALASRCREHCCSQLAHLVVHPMVVAVAVAVVVVVVVVVVVEH